MSYAIELTDTFGGEANYSWVRRAKVESPEWTTFKDWDGNGRREPKAFQRVIMTRAKRAVGMTGVRGRTEQHGDGYVFYPYGQCVVMFLTWED